MAAWLLLALVPAILELRLPRDADPLAGVGRDAGSLFYFANSFLTRASAEGLLGPAVPAAVSDGHMMSVERLRGVTAVDRDAMTVTVLSGTPLCDLNVLLAAEGLARRNLGVIAYQRVAGAIATTNHGNGAAFAAILTHSVGW